MKAQANLEVYRPFQGRVAERPRAPVALWRAGLRVAFRRRLALVLLFAPPVIATVIFSFVVYTRYALEEGTTPAALGGGSGGAGVIGQMAGAMVRDMAAEALAVRRQIVLFHLSMSAFSMLLVAWYGAGLIAEDRRVGAQLLLFARPLTRTGYLLGRFAIVATFGALGAVAPTMVVCLVATFASPEWSFVAEEGDVILRALVYGCAWVAAMSSLVLAISSLAPRRVFALAGVFGFIFLLSAVAAVLSGLLREDEWLLLSPTWAWMRIASHVFAVEDGPRWDVRLAYASVAGLLALSWTVLAWRVRRMEAVA